MNYGKVIFEILRTDSELITLLGGTSKIFPIRIPQETAYPAITYTKLSQSPNHTKTGPSLVDEVRIQIDTYSKDYAQLVSIDKRVRTLLDYYTGTIVSVNVDSIWFVNSTEVGEPELGLKHFATDYQMRINRI